MKILLLTGSWPPETGGIAAFVRGLAGGLARRGVGVHVIACTHGAEHHPSPDIEVTEFALPSRGYLQRLAACRNAVLRHLESNAFDRILTSSWSPFAVPLARIRMDRRPKLEVLCHGMDLIEPARSIRYRWLMRRTLAAADRVLANSHFTAHLAQTAGADVRKTVVLNPGIDADLYEPASHSESRGAVLLSIGRLIERKGFDVVIRALPRVLEHHPQLTYIIIGDGPDRLRLQGLAESCGVSQHVRFVGDMRDREVAQFYRSSDVFVMPARHLREKRDVEGFGIVFLEAGACELPVIAGRSGGMADAVVDGVTGYLVDPENIDGLAARLNELLNDRALRRRMGTAARQRVLAEFTWDRVAERYLDGLPA